MAVNLDQVIESKTQLLSSEAKTKILAIIDYLLENSDKQDRIPPRILGLNRGELWVSDDFDEPLADDFWLGKA